MWAVLQCFGFGEHFVSMIKTLYHSPAASVITGNIISPSFPLQRGTRQGCPLSPFLFCLSLEPLAQAIRKSEVSIKIHDHNHSISLYADDIILYLDHFDISVSSVIKEFDNFSSLSGYKINWGKSALMPINLLTRTRTWTLSELFVCTRHCFQTDKVKQDKMNLDKLYIILKV